MRTLFSLTGLKEQELFLDPTGLTWIAKACKGQGIIRTRRIMGDIPKNQETRYPE